MSLVNVTAVADGAGGEGVCARGDIDDASSARTAVKSQATSGRRRSVGMTTSPKAWRKV
jgi:hypothetical protein